MRRAACFVVLALASSARAQPLISPEQRRCIAPPSLGEWDAGEYPHCQCPEGALNAFHDPACREPGDYCIRNGAAAAPAPAEERPTAASPSATPRRRLASGGERRAPRRELELRTSGHISIDPVRASARPEEEVNVRVQALGLPTFSHMTLRVAGSADCLVHSAGEDLASELITIRAMETNVFVSGGVVGECLLSVRAIAREGTFDEAEGLYRFEGEPAGGSRPEVAPNAPRGEASCRAYCEALGETNARWNADARQCEPIDTARYVAAPCTILAKPGPPPAPPAAGPSCEERCRDHGELTRWNPASPEVRRCEPTDSARYLAGRCTITARAPEARRPQRVRLSCESFCDAHRPHSRWNPEAPEDRRCEPTDPAHYVASACAVMPRALEPRAPLPPQIHQTVVREGEARVHVGPEALTAGFFGRVDMPLGAGPGVNLRIDLGPHAELIGQAGLFFAGTDENPIGSTVRGRVTWFFSDYFGVGAGPHAHFLGIDPELLSQAVEVGGHLVGTLRVGPCRAEAGPLVGTVLPDNELAVGYLAALGCGFP